MFSQLIKNIPQDAKIMDSILEITSKNMYPTFPMRNEGEENPMNPHPYFEDVEDRRNIDPPFVNKGIDLTFWILSVYSLNVIYLLLIILA